MQNKHTLVAGVATPIALEVPSPLRDINHIALELSLWLSYPQLADWDKVYTHPEKADIWSGAQWEGGLISGVVTVPMHPFPVSTPIFELRWEASVVCTVGGQPMYLEDRVPLDVVRPSLAALSATDGSPDGDAPMRWSDVGWLVAGHTGSHSAEIEDQIGGKRVLSWGNGELRLDGALILDAVGSLSLGRAWSGDAHGFVVEMRLLRTPGLPRGGDPGGLSLDALDLGGSRVLSLWAPLDAVQALDGLPWTQIGQHRISDAAPLRGLVRLLVDAGVYCSPWSEAATQHPQAFADGDVLALGVSSNPEWTSLSDVTHRPLSTDANASRDATGRPFVEDRQRTPSPRRLSGFRKLIRRHPSAGTLGMLLIGCPSILVGATLAGDAMGAEGALAPAVGIVCMVAYIFWTLAYVRTPIVEAAYGGRVLAPASPCPVPFQIDVIEKDVGHELRVGWVARRAGFEHRVWYDGGGVAAAEGAFVRLPVGVPPSLRLPVPANGPLEHLERRELSITWTVQHRVTLSPETVAIAEAPLWVLPFDP